MKNNREEGNNQRKFRDAPELTMQPSAGKTESVRRGDKKRPRPGKAQSSAAGKRK